MAPNKIEELKEILRLSPSSINSQPWKFTLISDEKTKQQLAKASFFNDKKVEQCDTVVVFSRINNIELFEKQITATLPEGAVGYYKQFLKPKPESEIKAWFDKQVYLALGVFLSACAEMKIDSTPMEGIEPEKYDEILGQKDYSELVAVAIGYRDGEDFNQINKTPKSRNPIAQVITSI
ncbi:nitroreductase family protein [Aquimarina rhabdastrellae]